MEQTSRVTLVLAKPEEFPQFKARLCTAFAIAVEETFGPQPGEVVSDQEFQESVGAPGAVVYHVMLDGKQAGGVVVCIDPKSQHNSLELFFIDPQYHSAGIGLAAWQAVEQQYPDTVIWETVTPYFEKRNIHFYVNKCGFHAVEFWNDCHCAPHMPPGEQAGHPTPGCNEAFRFEKVMKPGLAAEGEPHQRN